MSVIYRMVIALKNNLLYSVLALLLIGAPSVAQDDQKQLLSYIRDQLPTAFKDDKSCSAMLEKYRKVKPQDPVLKGYIGGLYIARSKHAPLLDKREALKTGTTMLEQAISEKPDNIELIFLRLSIQLNLPGFLGYNDNIDTDRKFVIKNYVSAPPVLKSRIVNFVKTSGHFTEDEIARVSD